MDYSSSKLSLGILIGCLLSSLIIILILYCLLRSAEKSKKDMDALMVFIKSTITKEWEPAEDLLNRARNRGWKVETFIFNKALYRLDREKLIKIRVKEGSSSVFSPKTEDLEVIGTEEIDT